MIFICLSSYFSLLSCLFEQPWPQAAKFCFAQLPTQSHNSIDRSTAPPQPQTPSHPPPISLSFLLFFSFFRFVSFLFFSHMQRHMTRSVSTPTKILNIRNASARLDSKLKSLCIFFLSKLFLLVVILSMCHPSTHSFPLSWYDPTSVIRMTRSAYITDSEMI